MMSYLSLQKMIFEKAAVSIVCQFTKVIGSLRLQISTHPDNNNNDNDDTQLFTFGDKCEGV